MGELSLGASLSWSSAFLAFITHLGDPADSKKQVNRLAISPDKLFVAAAGNAQVRYAHLHFEYWKETDGVGYGTFRL